MPRQGLTQLEVVNRKRKLEQLINDVKLEEIRIEDVFLQEVSSMTLADLPWFKCSNSRGSQWQGSRLPLDEAGSFTRGEPAFIADLRPILPDFLELDKSSNNSLATLRWCPMLVKVFPEMRAWRLVDMLTALVLRCWETRAETAHESQFDFVEYFAGHGNLSRERIKNGWCGMATVILYSEEHHDLTKASGLQLALGGIFSCEMHALNWMATKRSSFVTLCQCQAQRLPVNDFLGDCSKQFARDGNALMDVTALLYLLAPLCANLSLVLKFSNARMTSTYGAAFGQTFGRTVQELNKWPEPSQMWQLPLWRFVTMAGSLAKKSACSMQKCTHVSLVRLRSIVSSSSYQAQCSK